MNYDRMSNRKLHEIVKLRMPGIHITGVDANNRSTVIAFLKVSEGMGITTAPKTHRRSTKAV